MKNLVNPNPAKYTDEQASHIAWNYLLTHTTGYYQILSFGKIENALSPYNYNTPVMIVNVRCLNKYGTKKTEKVYIHESGNVGGYEFKNNKIEELLTIDKLPNTEFTMSFEEATKILREENAASKAAEFLRKLQSELNYNIKQQRSPKAARRSYVKYDIETLEGVMDKLTEVQQEYLRAVIDQIQIGDDPKALLKAYIAKLTGAKKELFEAIEATFKAQEEKIFERVLIWFREDEDNKGLKEAKLIEMAHRYIDQQKWNLFRGIHNHLGQLDITKTVNTHFRNTHNGFEGNWILTLADGTTRDFETRTIIAEGLIQRAHYRYLVHVKK